MPQPGASFDRMEDLARTLAPIRFLVVSPVTPRYCEDGVHGMRLL